MEPPATPIEALFEQLKEGQEFATEGKEKIEDSQLMRLTYDSIKATGLFNDQCKIWRNKSVLLKTYDHLITYFTDSDTDRRQNERTSGSARYSAHTVHEVVREEFNSILVTQESTPPMTHADIESLLSESSSRQAETQVEQANAVTMSELKEFVQTLMTTNNGNDN